VPEIQKADSNARRMGVVIVVSGTVLGIALLSLAATCRPAFDAWVKQDVDARSRTVMIALTLVTAGPAFGMAVYLWHLGRRIVRVERYPPPGLRVVRDMVVVAGPAARRRGRIVQALGAVIGSASVVLAFFLWRLLFLLKRG